MDCLPSPRRLSLRKLRADRGLAIRAPRHSRASLDAGDALLIATALRTLVLLRSLPDHAEQPIHQGGVIARLVRGAGESLVKFSVRLDDIVGNVDARITTLLREFDRDDLVS